MKERNVTVNARCNFCGKTVELKVTEESIKEYFAPNRRHIQDIFPYLTPSERELLISHMCEDCWNSMFSYEDEDDFDEEEYEEWDEYEPSPEDLKEWQEASCGLCQSTTPRKEKDMTYIEVLKIHTEEYMSEKEKELIENFNKADGNMIIYFNDVDVPIEEVEFFLEELEFDFCYPKSNRFSLDVEKMLDNVVEANKYLRFDTNTEFETILISF